MVAFIIDCTWTADPVTFVRGRAGGCEDTRPNGIGISATIVWPNGVDQTVTTGALVHLTSTVKTPELFEITVQSVIPHYVRQLGGDRSKDSGFAFLTDCGKIDS